MNISLTPPLPPPLSPAPNPNVISLAAAPSSTPPLTAISKPSSPAHTVAIQQEAPQPSRGHSPDHETAVPSKLSEAYTLEQEMRGLGGSFGASTIPRSRAASSGPLAPPKSETPVPGLGGSPSNTGGPGTPRLGDGGRPLNVTDALSYLDAVKIQFAEKPDVYNQFLDIMKDFKSQLIDTPGVIERVSMLFHGNPGLIQGFNTFLPPGYHINCSTDPHDVNLITVTTPTGTTTSTIPTPAFGLVNASPFVPQITQLHAPLHTISDIPSASGSRPPSPHGRPSTAPIYYDPLASYSPGPQGVSTTAHAASVLGNMSNKSQNAVERAQQSGEFDHAIQYLNKIKTRYPDEPNTYKQFLEILQTYRKEQQIHLKEVKDQQALQIREQRMMQEVYVQVQVLFKDAPDLLGEFKDFLPEMSATRTVPLVGILPHPQSSTATSVWNHEAAPPSPARKELPPSRRRKRETGKESQRAEPGRDNRKKQRVRPAKGHAQSPTFTSFPAPASPVPGPSHLRQSASFSTPAFPGIHVHETFSWIDSPNLVATNGPGPAAHDEQQFFDRAKRTLEPRETWEDFLKLLNMYSKDIIETKQLIASAELFLGHGELLAQFKALLGWDDKRESVEYGPPFSIRTGPPELIPPAPVDDGGGPSYRRLPDSEARLATSGRDQLARSVLNDEWVSHPTWASEDGGFVTHKKNAFEEAMHKTEDERHEYEIHFEGIVRTIVILESLNARIEEMSQEERTQFRLKPDLGGESKCIYQRTIKKIYGKDAGSEVYQALQDVPSVTVPVVLQRLKQKCDEWRRAQRAWGITWRQTEAKTFYKSLDPMGINFKANDKKNTTNKSLVTEIEGIKAEQLQEMELEGKPTFIFGSPGHQLEYSFQDTAVLQDSLKLVYSYLDHNQAVYSHQERRSVEKFLRVFVPTLCMFPLPEFNAACGPLDLEQDDDDSGDEHVGAADTLEETSPHRGGRRSAGTGNASGGVHPGDLRKKLLKTAQEKWTARKGQTPSVAGSRAASPMADDLQPSGSRIFVQDGPLPSNGDAKGEGQNAPTQPADVWIRESLTDEIKSIREAPVSKRPFFANTTLYTLLRLLQLLYSRLSICKEVGAKHASQKFEHLLANPIAVELGLEDAQGPSAVLDQILETVQDQDLTEDSNVLYMYLLDSCEKLFDGEMDQATFEEHMRWFFGTKAFHLYTVDKVIAALIKQVQTVVTDNKCQELWYFLKKARPENRFTQQDVMRYRRAAERHVGSDDNLYGVEWDAGCKTMRIQLVGAEEASVNDGGTSVGRWREYVESYVMDHPTEWVGGAGVRGSKAASPIFLKRQLTSDDLGSRGTVMTEGSLGIRVSLGSYKLFYEAGTEETVWRRRGREEEAAVLANASAREEERRRSRWLG